MRNDTIVLYVIFFVFAIHQMDYMYVTVSYLTFHESICLPEPLC